jgi:hypothetical protein
LSLSPRENRFDIPRDIQSPHDIVDPSKFREGQRVQVHGLSAAWKYNGMCGKLLVYFSFAPHSLAPAHADGNVLAAVSCLCLCGANV